MQMQLLRPDATIARPKLLDRWRTSWLWSFVDRWLPPAVSAVVVVWFVFVAISGYGGQPVAFGYDYRFYREVGERWLTDGSYFWPHQLSGPYDFTVMVDVLYPPPALPLFVALAIVPAVLWWAVPCAVLAYASWVWRPSKWAVAAALILSTYSKSTWAWVAGNTDLWVMTAIFGGLLWGWPALLVALKPTLAPFALIGARHRNWWLALVPVAGISLLMLPLWWDYFTAMRNLRGVGLDYSLASLPLLFVPVVLYVGRRKRAQGPTSRQLAFDATT